MDMDMDKEIKLTRGALAGIAFSIAAVSIIMGVFLGLGKSQRLTRDYGQLMDRKDAMIEGLSHELRNMREDPLSHRIKICLPGDLDVRSKVILVRELTDLVLEDLEIFSFIEVGPGSLPVQVPPQYREEGTN